MSLHVSRFFWLSFIVALILSANGVGAAPLAVAPFDNPTFNSVDAQRAWQPQAGSAPVYAADAGEWGNEHVMVVPCNAAGQAEARCFHDQSLSAATDFSVYKEFSLEIFVPDPIAVSRVSLYFESVSPWQAYYVQTISTKQGWQTLTFRVPYMAAMGSAPSWERIHKIRLSPWRGSSSVPTNLAIRAFRAIPRSAVALIKDFPSGTFYEQTSKLLTNSYIAHDIVTVADVEQGLLRAAKLAILPQNASLPPAALSALENHVAAGGRIVAHHSIDARVQALLGVAVGAYTPGQAGQFSSFQFFDPIIPNLPPRVLQNSWAIMQAAPGAALRNPRVIANWNDYNGVAGPPAWIASDTGLYMSHVLLDDDANTKSKMLLSLLSHYFPQLLGAESSSAAIADIARVGKYTAYDEAVAGIRAGAASLPSARMAQVEAALADADALRNNALKAQSQERYADAVELAKRARSSMRDAYVVGQAAGPATEFRAVWSHDGAGPYRGDWALSIDALAGHGFNAVFPNVAGAGFADYASAYLPRSSTYTAFGDQLSAAITAARTAGVKTHAWILTWALHGAPESWIDSMRTQNRLMLSVVNNGGVLSLQPVTAPNWLSPCDQQNRDLIKAAILEMANNYELDGIHLDYIRTNGTNTPYELSCKARFEAETGKVANNWPADVWSGSLKAAYDEWKPTVISSFVKAVHDELIAVNANKLRRGQPHVTLSAAVFSDPHGARNANSQDWVDWIAKGAIDVLHPMNYFSDLADFNSALANQSQVINNRIPFYPGIGVAGSLSTDAMIARSVATRGDNPGGVRTGGFIHFNFTPDFATTYLPAYSSGITANKSTLATDLALTLTTSPQPALLGTPFTYTLTVTNRGPDATTGVMVYDWLPAGITIRSFTPSQGSCTAGVPLQCTLGSLQTGAQASVSISVVATASGSYRNNASVRSQGTDADSTNNAAAVDTTVTAPDLLSTGVTAARSEKTKILVSDTVKNQGNANAGKFVIRYYLSTDTNYNPQIDLALAALSNGGGTCTRTISALNAGTSASKGTICYRPTTAASRVNYYVLSVNDADNLVIESNESNNVGISATSIRW